MIKGLGTNANIFQNNSSGSSRAKESTQTAEQKATRIEQLKAAIDKGEYQVNLDKLAQKMAEEIS